MRDQHALVIGDPTITRLSDSDPAGDFGKLIQLKLKRDCSLVLPVQSRDTDGHHDYWNLK